MRTSKYLAPTLLLTGLLASGPVMAASISLATGRVEPDADGFGSATTATIQIGQEILDLGLAEFDIELAASKEIESGDAPGGNEYDFTSFGAALSARTAGPLYFIGRYGIARNTIDIDGGDDSTETQQSMGIGFGGSLGIVQFEATANRYLDEGDLDDITWLRAGIRF